MEWAAKDTIALRAELCRVRVEISRQRDEDMADREASDCRTRRIESANDLIDSITRALLAWPPRPDNLPLPNPGFYLDSELFNS